MRSRARAVAVAVFAVATLTGPAASALAQDTAAGELDRVRELVADEKWAAGEKALRATFSAFENDIELRGRVQEVEELLKQCIFRQTVERPSAEDLFGSAGVRFNHVSRKVTLEFTNTDSDLWEHPREGFQLLGLRLEGTFDIELTARVRDFMALCCYDVEKEGGYLVIPGAGSGRLARPSEIDKIEDGESKVLTSASVRSLHAYEKLKIARRGSDLRLTVGSEKTLTAKDSEYKSGYFAFGGSFNGKLIIKGKLDRDFYRTFLGTYLSDSFAAWEYAEWKREEQLPEWMQGGVSAGDVGARLVWPTPLSEGRKATLDETLSLFFDGDIDGYLDALDEMTNLTPATRWYLEGIRDLWLGNLRDAEQKLSWLIARHPEFKPAYVFRAHARLNLRQIDGCHKDLEAAGEECTTFPTYHVVQSILHLQDGEIDAAYRVLIEATAVGAGGSFTEEMQSWLLRAKRGPRWPKTFEHETEHFHVVSDHGKKMCFDVATLLERTRKLYARAVGEAQAQTVPSRVLIFSSIEDYQEYGGELAGDVSLTSGAYLPLLRELIIWIPIDRRDFEDTVRHEGFHQYLHLHIESAPLWFNEGYAESFGTPTPVFDEMTSEQRSAYFRLLLPLDELTRLPREEFMGEGVALNYAGSGDLVRFLSETKDARFKTILDDYLAALQAGNTIDAAYDAVLKDKIKELQATFKEWILAGS